MSAKRPGGGPDDAEAGSWATESLPMCVRKELLERELSRLGFRKAAQGAVTGLDAGGCQPQADAGSSHPQADSDRSAEHGG